MIRYFQIKLFEWFPLLRPMLGKDDSAADKKQKQAIASKRRQQVEAQQAELCEATINKLLTKQATSKSTKDDQVSCRGAV
jgi:hypothetical protein